MYTEKTFKKDAQDVLNAHRTHCGISGVDEFPETFEVTKFNQFADQFIKEHGIFEYVRTGYYKLYTDTMNKVTNAYDFNDFYEDRLCNLDVYKFQESYRHWYLVNDAVDLIDPDNDEDAERAMKVFNDIRNEVCAMPIEHAILFAILTESQHNETGGMCHDCDVPPLNVDYVLANNHNYSDLKINTAVPALLDLEGHDAAFVLKTLQDLKHALSHEIHAVEPGFEF